MKINIYINVRKVYFIYKFKNRNFKRYEIFQVVGIKDKYINIVFFIIYIYIFIEFFLLCINEIVNLYLGVNS